MVVIGKRELKGISKKNGERKGWLDIGKEGRESKKNVGSVKSKEVEKCGVIKDDKVGGRRGWREDDGRK